MASGGCSLVEVHWLLFSVASLAGAQAMGLWVLVVVALRLESTGSVVLVHRNSKHQYKQTLQPFRYSYHHYFRDGEG